jgi:hypothetical protein
MRPRHKKVAGLAATIAAAAGMITAADQFMAHRAADRDEAKVTADEANENFALRVEVCECRGGHWHRTGCVMDR